LTEREREREREREILFCLMGPRLLVAAGKKIAAWTSTILEKQSCFQLFRKVAVILTVVYLLYGVGKNTYKADSS
jgi:hypothetical protein